MQTSALHQPRLAARTTCSKVRAGVRLLSGVAACPIARPVAVARRAHAVVVRASDDPKGSGASKSADKQTKRFQEVEEQLRKSGMTPAKAREVLSVWAKLGAKDEEELKQLLVKQSLRPLTAVGLQTALDTVACLGGFFSGNLLGQADFPGSFFISLALYFAACWYGIQVFFEVSALAAIIGAARRYSADSSALLAAVQKLAGPGSGIGVVDAAQLAVNTLSVLQTLEAVFDALRESSGKLPASTLRNLSAYLTLQRATEATGFKPETYGLDQAQAAEIAAVFSEYDTNDDCRLELRELEQLCNALGKSLNEAELKEALGMLDSKETGYCQFEDFVCWWVGACGVDKPGMPKSEQAAA